MDTKDTKGRDIKRGERGGVRVDSGWGNRGWLPGDLGMCYTLYTSPYLLKIEFI